jgi:hypothetical protein
VSEVMFWLPGFKLGLGLDRLPTLGLKALETNLTIGKALCSGFVLTMCFGVLHPPSNPRAVRRRPRKLEIMLALIPKLACSRAECITA